MGVTTYPKLQRCENPFAWLTALHEDTLSTENVQQS